MQAPTHLVAGICLQKAVRVIPPSPWRYVLVALLALTIHGILDRLAKFTYHPPKRLWKDRFWIAYHSFLAVATIYILVLYWREYWFVTVFSIAPDFDWVMIDLSGYLGFLHYRRPFLHDRLLRIIDSIPTPSFARSLPNWNVKRKGVLVELLLLAILISIIVTID
jgi:hypothetical protein